MHTILQILEKTTEHFRKCGVPDPRLDAQYIIAHGLGIKRMDLYLRFDKPLSEQELQTLRPLVARRSKREPLQHILGNTSFRGHHILCDARALIPRPETELIIDEALQWAKAHPDLPQRFLDIATGTGAIAIAMAKEIAQAQVVATDISKDALALASSNVEYHELSNSLTMYQGDLWAALPAQEPPFGFIASNLPYIATHEIAALQPEVRVGDPMLALDGGVDGLQLVYRLLDESQGRLVTGGLLLLELGQGQTETLQKECNRWPWLQWSGAIADWAGISRFAKFIAC